MWKESSLFFQKSTFQILFLGEIGVKISVFLIYFLQVLHRNFVLCISFFTVAVRISVFIVLYANNFLKNILSYTVNILAGIPSVIYGFFRSFCSGKVLEKNLKMSAGESVLAGADNTFCYDFTLFCFKFDWII